MSGLRSQRVNDAAQKDKANFIVRVATKSDFHTLYALGKSTLEFKVSSIEAFMDPDEFLSAILNSNGVFLLAEASHELAGFICASYYDIERGPKSTWACLVYLVVAPSFRHQGITERLGTACVRLLKQRGVNHVYAWANTEGNASVIEFMKQRGFKEGHKYLWMDRAI